MQMIEIAALENGAHNNQTYHGFLPDGWALITVETETLKNFPFGTFKTSNANGLVYMDPTTWIAGEMPEAEESEEPEEEGSETSVWDELDAAYQEGVDSV